MLLHQLDPYVRFAASVFNGVMPTEVKVTDCRIFFVEEGARVKKGDALFQVDRQNLENAVRAAKSVAIVCHISPDGDTVGSALAMRLGLPIDWKNGDHFSQMWHFVKK